MRASMSSKFSLGNGLSNRRAPTVSDKRCVLVIACVGGHEHDAAYKLGIPGFHLPEERRAVSLLDYHGGCRTAWTK